MYSRHVVTALAETPEAKMAACFRGVRAEANMSQEDLGLRIGRYFGIPAIDQKTISRWENKGSIPGCYLGAVANICGVPPERMMV